MALDATVGGANANSYLTVAEADAYFAARLHSDVWDALSEGEGEGEGDSTKEAALIWATRLFDSKIKTAWDKASLPGDATIRILSTLKRDPDCFVVWNGEAASETQALAWPRSGMKSKNGFDFADDVIPQQVKDAVCELAKLLIAGDRTVENEVGNVGLTELRAGPVTLKFAADPPNMKLLPDFVFELLVASWWFCFVLEKRQAVSMTVL